MTVTVPERNRAIKKLLEATYGKGCVSVTAGDGTAYHWVEIKFNRRLEPPTGGVELSDYIANLIRSHGIYISQFNADDMGGKRMLPCLNVRMPREAKS